jgi:hypothetical protein
VLGSVSSMRSTWVWPQELALQTVADPGRAGELFTAKDCPGAVWKLASENACRDLMRSVVLKARKEGSTSISPAVPILVDAAIDAATKEQCSTLLPLELLEIVMDATPTAQCSDLWKIVEARRERLGRPPFVPTDPTSNPLSKVALLRLSNSLLRRLSDVHDAELCGRVLLLLAYAFPLSERSALNITGRFNTDNVTKRAEEEADGPYSEFWKLQDVMVDPTLAIASVTSWQGLVGALTNTLDVIQGGCKRDNHGTSRTAASATRVVKHLTAPSLFELQLRDATFCSQILVQLIIFLAYLSDLPASRVPGPGVRSRLLDDLPELVGRCWKLLSAIGGASQTGIVRQMVSGDDSWVRWKRNGCPAIDERPTMDADSVQRALEAGEAILSSSTAEFEAPLLSPRTDCWMEDGSVPSYVLGLGADPPLERSRRLGKQLLPPLSRSLEELKEALDPESFMYDVESAPHRDSRWAWKAMRLMRRDDPGSFGTIISEAQFVQVIADLAQVPVPQQDLDAIAAAAAKRAEHTEKRRVAASEEEASSAPVRSTEETAPTRKRDREASSAPVRSTEETAPPRKRDREASDDKGAESQAKRVALSEEGKRVDEEHRRRPETDHRRGFGEGGDHRRNDYRRDGRGGGGSNANRASQQHQQPQQQQHGGGNGGRGRGDGHGGNRRVIRVSRPSN